MPKMSVISMFANDPSICTRLTNFFSSTRFIGATLHHVMSRLSSGGRT
jgi:hypothetical protein